MKTETVQNGNDIESLTLRPEADDEETVLFMLKTLFETRDSDIVLRIHVMDGVLSDVELIGTDLG